MSWYLNFDKNEYIIFDWNKFLKKAPLTKFTKTSIDLKRSEVKMRKKIKLGVVTELKQ